MAAPSAGFGEAQRLLSWEEPRGTLQLAARGPGCWQSWEGCPDPQLFILRPFACPLTLSSHSWSWHCCSRYHPQHPPTLMSYWESDPCHSPQQ